MTSKRDRQTNKTLFRTVHLYRTLLSITLKKKMISTSNKHQLQLTFQTFEKDPQLNIRKAVTWMTNERSEQASGQLFRTVYLYRTFLSIAS